MNRKEIVIAELSLAIGAHIYVIREGVETA